MIASLPALKRFALAPRRSGKNGVISLQCDGVRRSNPHTRRGLTPRHVAAAAAVVLGVLLASAVSRSRRRVASAQSASL
jgi:hypothetical protein